MSFKLLAIRPLKGCSKDVLKNLEEDKFYFFDNSYEQYGDSDYIVKKENVTDLPDNFFLQKNAESSLEYINVQAIVGKNGSGKSALVEFLLRVLNNLYKYSKFQTLDFHNLLYINKVVGEFYLEYKNKLIVVDFNFNNKDYVIDEITESELHSYFVNNQALRVRVKLRNRTIDLDVKKKLILKSIQKLFYTIYLNYSLYGLDELDFINEAYETVEQEELNQNGTYKNSWLSKIFHKNDGYRTPIVIHPYRETGTINVRNEKVLMTQRLSVLLFTNPEYRQIISGFEFEKIEFQLKKSKLSEFLDSLIYKQLNVKENFMPLDIAVLSKYIHNKEGVI